MTPVPRPYYASAATEIPCWRCTRMYWCLILWSRSFRNTLTSLILLPEHLGKCNDLSDVLPDELQWPVWSCTQIFSETNSDLSNPGPRNTSDCQPRKQVSTATGVKIFNNGQCYTYAIYWSKAQTTCVNTAELRWITWGVHGFSCCWSEDHCHHHVALRYWSLASTHIPHIWNYPASTTQMKSLKVHNHSLGAVGNCWFVPGHFCCYIY